MSAHQKLENYKIIKHLLASSADSRSKAEAYENAQELIMTASGTSEDIFKNFLNCWGELAAHGYFTSYVVADIVQAWCLAYPLSMSKYLEVIRTMGGSNITGAIEGVTIAFFEAFNVLFPSHDVNRSEQDFMELFTRGDFLYAACKSSGTVSGIGRLSEAISRFVIASYAQKSSERLIRCIMFNQILARQNERFCGAAFEHLIMSSDEAKKQPFIYRLAAEFAAKLKLSGTLQILMTIPSDNSLYCKGQELYPKLVIVD